MMSILAPFRREDATEVMYLLGRSGGLERLNFGPSTKDRPDDPDRWHFWRIVKRRHPKAQRVSEVRTVYTHP